MKLSMMSYTMSRQPDVFNLKTMFELAEEVKLRGIDMVTLYDKNAVELRKMADDYGISVICYTFFVKLDSSEPKQFAQALDDTKRGIEAAIMLGAPIVMIPTPNYFGIKRAEDRCNWINGLNAVISFAEQANVTLTIENYPGEDSPFVKAEDFLKAASAVSGLKLTYDNGNAASGEEPSESFTRCAKYAVHSHFKDWDIAEVAREGYRRMLDGRYYKPELIGEGCVNHLNCLRAMKSAGYDGYINIEYEGDKYRPDEAVRRAADYLRGLNAEL